MRRSFCSQCGSTIFFESERRADKIHIALAYMEGPIDRASAAHVFYDSHEEWNAIGNGLPRRNAHSGVEPLDAG